MLSHCALFLLLAAHSRAAPVFVTKEPGIRTSSGVFQAAVGGAYPLRFYYIRGSSQVVSATTADGLTFVDDNDVRLSSLTVPSLDIAISSITGLSVLPLTAGGFRMLYSVIGTTGAFRIYSATSADGLAWANDTGTAVNVAGGLTFSGFPSLANLGGGTWRLYYVQNSVAGNQAANHQIFTALSANEGRNWAAGSPAVAQQAGEVAAATLTNGRIRLFYTAPLAGQTTNTQVLSALSTDVNGISFNLEPGIRLSTGAGLGSLSAPLVVRSTDSFRWRMYYNYTPFVPPNVSTADVFSAVTDAPNPQGVAPSSVFRNQPGGSIAVVGEVFSPGLTAKFSQAGSPDIVGAGLVYTNDQNFSMTFNTQNAALGFWDLVVTDADGVSATLPGILNVDFQGGSVNLLDNLLRPRQGTSTKITINIFNAGKTSIKLYTLRGELVEVVFDGDLPAGTTNFFWNGTNASGRTVASGVYLLVTKGPKLDAVSKIVVIK